jgi:hypothetical protein
MIDGVQINIGGTDYTVPPLNLKAVKKFSKNFHLLSDLGNNINAEMMTFIADIIHTALIRNYPDITLDQVEEMVDIKTVGDILEAVLSSSGIERKKKEPETLATT